MSRGPSVYVHGVDSDGRPSPVAIIPARVAAWLERYAGLDEYRRTVKGTDPDVDDVLFALHQVALSWRGSATGTREAAQPELATNSDQWLSTTQASSLLRVGDRAVRKAIQSGHLQAESINGRWRISREAAQHYAAQQRRK